MTPPGNSAISRFMRYTVLIVVALAIAGSAAAVAQSQSPIQAADGIDFEVVSIKPNRTGAAASPRQRVSSSAPRSSIGIAPPSGVSGSRVEVGAAT